MQVVPAEGAPLNAEVNVVERLGGETFFHVRLVGQTAIAKVTGDAAASAGDRVGLAFDSDSAHFFMPEGRRLQ